ncbi:hypothetical protein NA57DRAFT_72725 [Rhizodiscina lignyota]|uniref:Uncharacterized protein n=1 Tax=Rhizodiscina lignyota TaxID=1504668 RepID=A0A9P4IJT0_9PEZI|nr:hypothetical protein NA57DRAFT_72725 [Rhizodiscina lignyota]
MYQDKSPRDSSDKDAEEPLLEEETFTRSSRSRRCLSLLPWILTAVLATACVLLLLDRRAYLRHGSFDRGYSTDFAGAKPFIRLKDVRFTGSPEFGPDGEERVPLDSPSLQYIGNGKAVDDAWTGLVKDRYFLLTDDEAREAWGSEYTEYWDELRGGYLAGLDMFHTLHCLDHIRMAFYPELYPENPIHGQIHRDHCVDHLRQMIMCNADLTVIPTKFFSGIGKNYINSDRRHTCRDFSKIREWTTSRYNGTLAVKARNKDGSPRDAFFVIP